MKDKTIERVVWTVCLALVMLAFAWSALAQSSETDTKVYWGYRPPYLGIRWTTYAYQMNLGCEVKSVEVNSPADIAGIRPGDYIVAIQKGFDFFMPRDLDKYCQAGDVVLVILKRYTGHEQFWNEYTTFGRYVRLASRTRVLQPGEC